MRTLPSGVTSAGLSRVFQKRTFINSREMFLQAEHPFCCPTGTEDAAVNLVEVIHM